jgi:signal transduction histidine kinase
MRAAESTERGQGSLERRLPLMISGLLTVTVVAFGIVAFKQVRQTSLDAATVQLKTLLAQTVDQATRSATIRTDSLKRLAADVRIVHAARQTAALDDSAAGNALRERRALSEAAAVQSLVLVREDGTRRTLVGRAPSPSQMRELDSLLARSGHTDSVATSTVFISDSAAHSWMVAPVRANTGPVGFLAELRRTRGAPTIEQQLKGLTGQAFSVYVTSKTGDVWIGARGTPVRPLFDVRAVPDSFRLTATSGDNIIGGKSAVPGTPWVVIFTIPTSSINAHAVEFVRRMLGIGALLLVIGLVGARWVSRQVTLPLQSLTRGARDIAQGDFSRRELVMSDDEIGQLAAAFNRMAERIGQSHEQLGRRMRELEALAAELRERNHELQSAQRQATEARIASDLARADAQRANSAKSDFLAMMSHELRTPLSAIAGYAEILQLGIRGKLNPAQQGDLSRIQANQAHLLRIINDILDLTQVESGQLAINAQHVALTDVLADIDPIVRPFIDECGIKYGAPDDSDVRLVADRERLAQVLINLIANATRFTPAGGLVAVRLETDAGRARIRVIDSGVGIAPDAQDRVFLPFVQGDSSAARANQGTGLGLTISRSLVEAMGGTLTLESELGVGSAFTIELAVATREPTPKPVVQMA